MYAQYQKSKADREKAIGKKNGTVKTAASVGAMSALDQMDGGNEIYDSYQVARTLSAPALSAAETGKRLYRTQAAKAKAAKIKKVQAGRKIGKKAVKESASKSAKHTAKTAVPTWLSCKNSSNSDNSNLAMQSKCKDIEIN